MKVLDAKQMQEVDQCAIKEFKIPGLILMENAGLKVIDVIKGIFPDLIGKRVVVLVGKGNNGGDGLVIARHLSNAGAKVGTFIFGLPEQFPADSRSNYEILANMQEPIWLLNDEQNLEKLQWALLKADLIVDSIYGIGFKGVPSEFESEVIRSVNSSRIPIVSVDIPSGVEADNGSVHGEAVRATHTVTFALPKLGHFLEPGSLFVGELTIADISIPSSLLVDDAFKISVITDKLVSTFIEPRAREVHKGSFGHVLAIGGSIGLSGAIMMAARSSLKVGAGMVTAAVPESILNTVATATPEIMTIPLQQTASGQISTAAVPQLIEKMKKATVCTIGPGLGRYPEAHEIMNLVLKETDLAVVVDADGLMALRDDLSMVAGRSASVVLTPHPGEFASLTGLSIDDIQGNRIATAQEFASKWGVVLVLKGNKTIVALPNGEVYINLTGNPGMATAGSGDVLAGMIGGFIAQGIDAGSAALIGVYLHGLSGDRARMALGERSLLAGDIIEFLPEVLKEYENSNRSSNRR